MNGSAQFGYMVFVPQAGSYTVTLQLDGRSTTNAASAQFYVNQQAQGGVITIAASPSGTASKPAAFNITLPSGIVLLELEGTSGTSLINSIVVAADN